MNSANDPSWSGGGHYDPQTHDFGDLLDLDNLGDLGPLNLDFPLDFQDNHFAGHSNGGQQQDGRLPKTQDGQHVFNGVPVEHHGGGAGAQQHQHQQHGVNQGNMAAVGSNSAFYDFSMSQFNRPFAPRAGVPPTPNSSEFHGNAGAYGQHMQTHAPVFDHDSYMHKDDPSFTPLVSPAVTPFDIRSHLDYQTIAPGAYFSPLTSPALVAQNHKNAHIQPAQAQYTSGSSTDASPLDIDMGMDIEMGLPQQEPVSRPPSNKRRAPEESISPVEQANTSWKGRRASLAKPRRQNSKLSNSVTHDDVGALTRTVADTMAAPTGVSPVNPRSNGSSGVNSAEPDRISDMGPPPLPGSITHSPATFGSGKQSMCPATPASLMHIHQTPSFSEAAEEHAMLDDLVLPEASMPKPPPPRNDIVQQRDDGSSSRASTSSRKTPKLNPLSTPSGDIALSGKPSPMLAPNVPISPITPAFAQAAASKRPDPKSSARASKKRASITAPLVSPAIMPKVSPSIKPLASDGHPTSHIADTTTHALLLASKSNYQNIIDGTTIPGVSYPASLASNLTSKRTSHKLAEQGRRNRINTALAEMQALLPSSSMASPSLGAKDAKSPDMAEGSAGASASANANKSNDSKAAKVESAIEYIKQLQKENREKDRLLEEMRKEIEELKKGEKSVGRADAGGGERKTENGVEEKKEGVESATTEARDAT